MKNRDIVNLDVCIKYCKYGLIDAEKKLHTIPDMPFKLMYALGRTEEHLKSAIKSIKESEDKINSEYLTKDKKGERYEALPDGRYDAGKKQDEYENKIQELFDMAEDVKIHKVSLDAMDFKVPQRFSQFLDVIAKHMIDE